MKVTLTQAQKRALQLACIRGVKVTETKYLDSLYTLQTEGFIYLDQPTGIYRPTREGKLLAEELVTKRGFVDTETYRALIAKEEKRTEEQEKIVKAFDAKYDLYAPIGYKMGRKKAS